MSTAFLPVEGDEASIRDWFHQVVNARENPVALQESLEWIQQSLAATGKSPLPPFCKGGLPLFAIFPTLQHLTLYTSPDGP